MTRDFTVEYVERVPFEDNPPLQWRIILCARMNDGRAFINEQWISQEMLDAVGEDRLFQDMRDAAHPPEEPMAEVPE